MVIIDAYNVLNVEGVLPAHLAAPDLIQLVALIRASRYASQRPILVCDGHSSGTIRPRLAARSAGRATNVTLDGIEILFSGAGEEADDLIERLLAHFAGSARLLLVSSDRRLQRAARKAGGRYREAGAFLADLAADASLPRTPARPEFVRRTPLSRGDIAFWMRAFGVGEPVFDRPQEADRPDDPVAEPHPGPQHEPSRPPAVDPVLRQLIENSGVEIDLAELDMQRWVQGVERYEPFSSE